VCSSGSSQCSSGSSQCSSGSSTEMEKFNDVSIVTEILGRANDLTPEHKLNFFFFCVGVVYSGEYDVCDVTLRVTSQTSN
jgi:hypothetical protein